VGTPIGNLGDITLRALGVLQQVDLVLAEDTRTSIKLLDRYGISRALESLHQQNEASRVDALIDRIVAGSLAVALVSDAGTPLVSDPGYLLVKACYTAGLPVRFVPGASAVLGALTISGLPSDRFTFEGFLPVKRGARMARLQELKCEPRTLVMFEAPHRIHVTLADMLTVFGAHREIAVARELTKIHETLYRGTLSNVMELIACDPNGARGELVIVVGADLSATQDTELPIKLLTILSPLMTQRDAIEAVGQITGASRNTLYALALDLKKSNT